MSQVAPGDKLFSLQMFLDFELTQLPPALSEKVTGCVMSAVKLESRPILAMP